VIDVAVLLVVVSVVLLLVLVLVVVTAVLLPSVECVLPAGGSVPCSISALAVSAYISYDDVFLSYSSFKPCVW
jgi:hypothetical protein